MSNDTYTLCREIISDFHEIQRNLSAIIRLLTCFSGDDPNENCAEAS